MNKDNKIVYNIYNYKPMKKYQYTKTIRFKVDTKSGIINKEDDKLQPPH